MAWHESRGDLNRRSIEIFIDCGLEAFSASFVPPFRTLYFLPPTRVLKRGHSPLL